MRVYSTSFFNGTATTKIYTLSLHDALPISARAFASERRARSRHRCARGPAARPRSEEHTSELQSHHDLVCRLLLEKKNKTDILCVVLGAQHKVSIFAEQAHDAMLQFIHMLA